MKDPYAKVIYEKYKKHYRKALGRCWNCPNYPAPGRTQCEYHLAQARRYYHEAQARGKALKGVVHAPGRLMDTVHERYRRIVSMIDQGEMYADIAIALGITHGRLAHMIAQAKRKGYKIPDMRSRRWRTREDKVAYLSRLGKLGAASKNSGPHAITHEEAVRYGKLSGEARKRARTPCPKCYIRGPHAECLNIRSFASSRIAPE